jgi:hypothetical protein
VLAADAPFVIKPTPYSVVKDDLAAFDIEPGAGFNTSAMAAAIVPPATAIPDRRGGSEPPALSINPAETNAFRAINAAWKANGSVSRAGDRYVISGINDAAITQLAKSLGIQGEFVAAAGAAIRKPRIALFEPPNSMDAGWTKWVLERYGFEFISLNTPDITGNLRDRIDVLVIGDEVRGILPPGAFGRPAVPTPEDDARIKALDDFVNAGGTLVTTGRCAAAAIDQLKLPVKNALAGLNRQQFFANGSVLHVTTDPSQPVMAGMPKDADVFVLASPAFETADGFEGAVLASYPSEGALLGSGYLLGDQYLRGKAAAVEVKHGDGRVILIGFRPQWRGQPFGSFRVLFNALLR